MRDVRVESVHFIQQRGATLLRAISLLRKRLSRQLGGLISGLGL